MAVTTPPERNALRADEVYVACNICGHAHIMKRKNLKPPESPVMAVRIKGYGVYHGLRNLPKR